MPHADHLQTARSSQAQTYHAKEFMSAEQNYWKQGDTILGRVAGPDGRASSALPEPSTSSTLRVSLRASIPITGEQLVRHRNGQEYRTADGSTVKPVEHRAGWDATFSAPKVGFADRAGRRR